MTRSRSARVARPMIHVLLAAALCGLALFPLTAYAAPVTRDFETDPVGSVPAGCRTPADRIPASVTDRRAHGGARALLVEDTSTTRQTAVVCPSTGGEGADLRFAIYPESLDTGFLVSLLGSFAGKPETGVPAFHLMVRPDGSVAWFDGLGVDGLGWTQLSPPRTVPVGAWSTLTVQVPADHREARIYVGDGPTAEGYVGAAGPVGVSPVAQLTDLQFASAGSAPSGDTVVVDDVVIDDGQDAAPAPRHPVFTVDEPTIIDQTDQGFMQMPNTAVTVPRASGPPEVLVGYPVHGDATHDTGTALAASVDEGRTWSNADDRNPFPGEQSFYLSRLRSGELLAVSYHTFMIDGSGSTQAEVPTAVSSDGGRTWTHRAGRMTAPEAMRPISDGTSRPGHPLGGFVLVRGIVEDDDGTLYQSGYGYYAPDKKYRQIVLASTDGGENWTVRATVAVDPNLSDHPRYEGFCEGTFARAADGSLVTVMRTGNYQPLYQSRSTDDGATWSAPRPVVAGPDDVPVVGVFPELRPMGNGTLVLYVGRPGQSLFASTDGSGATWTAPAMVDYLNSGNGALVPLDANRLLAFGDRGADWTPNVPATKAVWSAPVTVKAPSSRGAGRASAVRPRRPPAAGRASRPR